MRGRAIVVTSFVVALAGIGAAAGLAVRSASAGAADDALSAFRKGDYARAAEIAGKVPATSKQKPQALYVAGEAELALERWEAAEKSFRGVLEKHPAFVPALAGLGAALTGQGKVREGAEPLTRAISLDNKDARAWRAQAENILAGGEPTDLEAAAINLEATMKLDPRDPFTNRLLVDVRLRLGQVDAAAKVVETFARTDKDAAMVHFLRGLVADRRGETADAVAAFEKALKKEERFLDAHKNLAILLVARNPGYADAKKLEKALSHAKAYADLGGKDEAFRKVFDEIRAAKAPPTGGPAPAPK